MNSYPSKLQKIKSLLALLQKNELKKQLSKIEIPDLASLLCALNLKEASLFIDSLLELQKLEDVLLELPIQNLYFILLNLEKSFLIRNFQSFNDENIAYFLSILDEEGSEEGKNLKNELFYKMDKKRQAQIHKFLSYPKNSAGRLMQTDFFHLTEDLTVHEALKILRTYAQRDSLYYIYCVNSSHQLIGTLALRILISAPPDAKLKSIVKKDPIFVSPESPSEEVARLVAHHNFIALPVLDKNKTLLGIIPVEDVVDIIQDQATEEIYAQAGLQADDRIFSSPLRSIKNRAPWMLLNLFLAGIASTVVSLFENTMKELIILASVKNIVASTGGNTAIQSLTVVTRGLATGDFNFLNAKKALLKEILSGIVIGLLIGLTAALFIYLWKKNLLVSIVIFTSMSLTSLIASFFGSLVPLIFEKLKIDPAAGSGVIVTMIVDIFSFFSFLGIASLGLKLTQAA